MFIARSSPLEFSTSGFALSFSSSFSILLLSLPPSLSLLNFQSHNSAVDIPPSLRFSLSHRVSRPPSLSSFQSPPLSHRHPPMLKSSWISLCLPVDCSLSLSQSPQSLLIKTPSCPPSSFTIASSLPLSPQLKQNLLLAQSSPA